MELRGVEPDDIADDAPLFGEGLGLESVEAFYIAGGIQERFGVKIDRTKLNQLRPHFQSVRTLAVFVMHLLAEGERHG
ncbi:phosphopantetheine-binding protein [Paenibacillus humicola]|uniref:phosphopantetheine-binding protein n=1 Tax=Paenibacillus humicola TaxID=3110540 RepID=UPI00237A7C17|nr:phosphopantetheine-binding protein [Paenibacillus humicola]